MKPYATLLIALVFSFNAFCQLVGQQLRDQQARDQLKQFTDKHTPLVYSPDISAIELPPLKERKMSSSKSDTIAVEFRSLTSYHVKGIKRCTSCVVKESSDGKALSAKFRKSLVHSNQGPVDSLYSLIGISIKFRSCANPYKIIDVVKIISQKKYVINFDLKAAANDTDKQKPYPYPICAAEFWIAIPKVENGFTIEYDFQKEQKIKNNKIE